MNSANPTSDIRVVDGSGVFGTFGCSAGGGGIGVATNAIRGGASVNTTSVSGGLEEAGVLPNSVGGR